MFFFIPQKKQKKINTFFQNLPTTSRPRPSPLIASFFPLSSYLRCLYFFYFQPHSPCWFREEETVTFLSWIGSNSQALGTYEIRQKK